MKEDILNKEDFQKILVECYENKEIKYSDFKITPLSENVEGMLGEHFKLRITYELNGESMVGDFFVKTMPTQTMLQQDMCISFNVYNKEIFIYQTLFKQFQERGYNTSFAPKCYLCKDSKTLVLEDLNCTGYLLSKRREFFDVCKCECLLKSLALFHAGGFMVEEAKSNELGRKYRLDEDYGHLFTETMFSDHEMVNGFYETMRKFCNIVIDTMLESKEWREDFKRIYNNWIVVETFYRESKCRKIIGHGDLWSNNMMFLLKKGIPTKCCLLDFQLLRYHHPGFDFLIAVCENTNSTLRNKYLDYLTHYYYGCLSDELKSQGYDIETVLPLEDFLDSVKVSELPAKHQALGAHIFMCLPPSELNDIVAGGDELMNDTFKGNDIEKFVRVFQTDELYRTIIIDDLYEIHRALKNQQTSDTIL